MISIELFDEFQSLGTVQLVPEVRKMTIVVAGPQLPIVTPAGGFVYNDVHSAADCVGTYTLRPVALLFVTFLQVENAVMDWLVA